ncbi:hypothetical protein A2U01_0068398, partial [Trifolium medium]|nr:hypothetical protein [Trifolium medium]
GENSWCSTPYLELERLQRHHLEIWQPVETGYTNSQSDAIRRSKGANSCEFLGNGGRGCGGQGGRRGVQDKSGGR